MWVVRSGKSLTFRGAEFELQCRAGKVGRKFASLIRGKESLCLQHPAGEAGIRPRAPPPCLHPSGLGQGLGTGAGDTAVPYLAHAGLPGSRTCRRSPVSHVSVAPRPLLNSNRCSNQTMPSQTASCCVISKRGATTKPKPTKQNKTTPAMTIKRDRRVKSAYDLAGS